MAVQTESVHARSVLVTFPKEYSLAEARRIIEHWPVDRWSWDIIEGHPVFLGVRNDKIISQKVKKLVKDGIKFETGNFRIPQLTSPPYLNVRPEPQPPIPAPTPSEPDCGPQEKKIKECLEEVELDDKYAKHLRSKIGDLEAALEDTKEELKVSQQEGRRLEAELEEAKRKLEVSQQEGRRLKAELEDTKKQLVVSQQEGKTLMEQVRDMKEHIDFLEEKVRDIPAPPVDQEQVQVKIVDPAPVPGPSNDINALKERILKYKKDAFSFLKYSPEVEITKTGYVRVRFRNQKFKDAYPAIADSMETNDEDKLKEFIDGWANLMKKYVEKNKK